VRRTRSARGGPRGGAAPACEGLFQGGGSSRAGRFPATVAEGAKASAAAESARPQLARHRLVHGVAQGN
jgi:hypothetical protein